MSLPNRVAIVHDWLTGMRGGERVLEELCRLFPNADIYTLLYIPGSVSQTIASHKIVRSRIQRLPKSWAFYRYFLPLFPTAIELFDLSEYELVVSSSHCVAKGVCTSADTLNVCYCYTPMRYAWDLAHTYFELGRMRRSVKRLASFVMNILRMWDVFSTQRVDEMVAISKYVGRRIRKYYRQDCSVIYPPVDCAKLACEPRHGDYYLTVSAPAPYKRLDLIVDAFKKLGKKLVIVGTAGRDLRWMGGISKNIEVLGWVSDDELVKLYQNCRAFVFAAEEDFGIAPVEAQAAGKPVIAYGRGGAVETVDGLWQSGDYGADKKKIQEQKLTGVFFYPQTASSLSSAVEYFERLEDGFDGEAIRAHAQRFDKKRFQLEFVKLVEERWKNFQTD